MKAKKTTRAFFTQPCPHCGGCGRASITTPLAGWFIDYHFQDGREQCGPYTKAEALKRMAARSETANKTLIGPDGFVYEVS